MIMQIMANVIFTFPNFFPDIFSLQFICASIKMVIFWHEETFFSIGSISFDIKEPSFGIKSQLN